ncbi:MAG: PTS fructose transporter subunit IIA [Streptococcus pyogenes]|nr:MAG: PTS fructose transporter subunit IIA [Streptococcus pyogenes]
MSKTLILVSHGNFCHALKQSTEMIMGPQNNIVTLGLEPEEGAASFKERFLKLIAPLADGDFLVFADLLGGTPCNVVSQVLLTGRHFELYAGMNMPMVISYLNAELLGQKDDIQAFARENIQKVNALLVALDDDDEA